MEYPEAASAVAGNDFVPQTSTDQCSMMPPVGEHQYCRLANFEIEKKIGRGQFSTVFRACCKPNGTIVALKKVQVGHCSVGIFMDVPH